MQCKFDALLAKQTWTLVPHPPGVLIMIVTWVFKHKLNSDSTLECNKSRWVISGFNQWLGINFGEMFSPVVKHAMVHIMLMLVATHRCLAHQLDASNAFLHNDIQEKV